MELNDFYLTQEYILSLTTQEKIFERYLYTPSMSGTYKNPFRVDEDPGCTFYYKNSKLYFVDWAWDKKHYDCFNVVMEYYKCSFSKALRHIKDDLDNGLVKKRDETDVNNKKEKGKVLKIKTRDYKANELAFWNIGGLVISQLELTNSGIYCVETIWENDWIIDNCSMTFAYVENKYITQIYFPLNKNTGRRRFINHEGYKIGGWQELPFLSDHVVISKSRKCRFYLNKFDITSINIVNESIVIDEEMYDSLKSSYKNIFYLGDNDYPGRRLAVKYRKKYPDIIILLFNKNHPKDFPDNLKEFGKEYIEKQIKIIREKFIKS